MIGDLFDSPWKVLIVAIVLIVLFGSKKLPDAARSLGRSMRILKTEVSDLHEDESEANASAAPAQTPTGTGFPAPAELSPVPLPRPIGSRRPISSRRSTRCSSRSAICSGPRPWTPRQPRRPRSRSGPSAS